MVIERHGIEPRFEKRTKGKRLRIRCKTWAEVDEVAARVNESIRENNDNDEFMDDPSAFVKARLGLNNQCGPKNDGRRTLSGTRSLQYSTRW